MPAVVAGAVANAFIGTAIAASTAYAVAYGIASIVISFGLSYLSQSLAGKSSKDAAAVRDGREITVNGTTQPRQLLYGEWRGSFYGA